LALMGKEVPELLTLHEAAERLGVHYMTIYRRVRLGMLPAHKTGGTWRIDATWLDAPAAITPAARRRAPWADRLRQRMVAGDAAGSWQLVESAMASGIAPEDVYAVMLAPALHAIGDAWRSGDLGVDQEHLASNVAIALIGRMSARPQRRGRHRGAVVVTAPAGERHGLGIAMLADTLNRAGYDVLNLGVDTPPPSLVGAIAVRDDIRAVVVSVVNSANLASAKRSISAVRRHYPGLPIMAGGFAVRDLSTAKDLGADGWTDDPRLVAAIIEDLSARPRSASAR
jgi:excisionase family DNA binding protein